MEFKIIGTKVRDKEEIIKSILKIPENLDKSDKQRLYEKLKTELNLDTVIVIMECKDCYNCLQKDNCNLRDLILKPQYLPYSCRVRVNKYYGIVKNYQPNKKDPK